jgi:hypothetical protein
MTLRMTEFEVLQDVAGLLDQLDANQQKQVMSMLATRYKLKLVDTTPSSGGGSYRPGPRRKTKPY